MHSQAVCDSGCYPEHYTLPSSKTHVSFQLDLHSKISGQMPRNEAGTKQSCQQTDDLCSNFELRIGNGQPVLNLCST